MSYRSSLSYLDETEKKRENTINAIYSQTL